MVINPDLVRASTARLNFDPRKRSQQLSDGPRRLTNSQKEDRYRSLLAATGSPRHAREVLERFIGGNDLVGINYLTRGLLAARSVCRIRLNSAEGKLVGYGTGFLVGPGVVMTNHHVLSTPDDAAYAVCDFNYELDPFDRECAVAEFKLEPQRLCYANRDLDFAAVAVAPVSLDGRLPLAHFLWLALRGEPGKTVPGEYLSIVQHPGGERKQVCVRENKMLKYDDRTVWYQTDTVPGSSGSPVFNNLWQVVALHHSGVPETDARGRWLTVDGRAYDPSMDESQVKWKANEGIRVSQIVTNLQSALGSHPLVRGVLDAPDPLPPHDPASNFISFDHDRDGHDGADEADASRSELRDGALHVTIPIRLAVRIGDARDPFGLGNGGAGGGLVAAAGRAIASASAPPAIASPPPRPSLPAVSAVVADAVAVEAVQVDQSKILSRPGFRTDFLGSAPSLQVPLPTVADAQLKRETLNWRYKGKSGTILNFYNYSVLMNRSRKMAFYSAVNVDGTQLQDVGKREGDRWYEDPRAARSQVNDTDFYKRQLRPEETDRLLNPFDRGHLTRRLDATWGPTVDDAKRNGDDSFHFVNCTPQFWRFNQGNSDAGRLWAGIEDFTMAAASRGTKMCVINGPVFDAPRAVIDDHDGQPYPDPAGKRQPDPKLLDVSIPRWFWKVVVTVGPQRRLDVRAYILSQEDFLDRIEGLEELRLRPLTDAQARAYGIGMADLERLTGLGFGALAAADGIANEIYRRPWPLRDEGDLRL